MGALAQNRQLHLAHRSLHAEQEPVIGEARIVHAVFIDDQRPDQAAELQQRVPVASIAGEARSSIDTTAPTRPSQIAARSFSNPGRETPEPERPRSSSIRLTSAHPSCRARSTNPY